MQAGRARRLPFRFPAYLGCTPTQTTPIDGRVAFQTDTQDEFTAAVERLTHRRVVAFMSANQTAPGVAAELFFLDATPLAAATSLT